jgi:chitodextrinase
MARALRAFTLLAAVAALTACNVKDTTAPPLSGPSELGLSLTIQASPDVLTQDGASQSQVVVLARDGSGQPVRNITCRVEILVDNVIADFGMLSSRNISTGSDGRAVVSYTAPPAPVAVTANTSTIMLLVTPIGTDFANAIARSVTIRLVPSGTINPPAQATPGFAFSPDAPGEGQAVSFDGSYCTSQSATNCSLGSIVGWAWTFGDGGTGTGAVCAHTYALAGSYYVTLTVTDAQGRAASTTRIVKVGAATAPTAAFDVSPAAPLPLQQVFFNASASKAAPGREIVSYEWDFGDGDPHKFGVTVQHDFAAEATYTVTLVVTDDAGRKGTISKALKVGVVTTPAGR